MSAVTCIYLLLFFCHHGTILVIPHAIVSVSDALSLSVLINVLLEWEMHISAAKTKTDETVVVKLLWWTGFLHFQEKMWVVFTHAKLTVMCVVGGSSRLCFLAFRKNSKKHNGFWTACRGLERYFF